MIASQNHEMSDRAQRLGDVLAGWLEAVENGQAPDRQEWLKRYPEFAAELSQFFAGQEEIGRLAAPLREVQREAERGTPLPVETSRPAAPGGADLKSVLQNRKPSLGPESLPGSLGDYELLGEIGRGGMGIVYKARHKKLNRYVAVKMILASSATSTADVQRFRNEAEAVAQLDHRHIVPIYEVGEQDGQLYFSMKLVEGSNLTKALPRFRDDPRSVARLMESLARAIQHAHQRGILHRDLKPANILLDAEGQAYITDFGLARRLQTDEGPTQLGEPVGTPNYMAPEQASGKREAVTTAIDIHGLGTILYSLLTERPPFQGSNLLETLRQVREVEPEMPSRSNPGVDRDLEAICLRCLKKEPPQRYADARALADELGRYLAGEPTQARPLSSWVRTLKWATRHPAGALLLAISACSAVTLLAVILAYAAQLRGKNAELAASIARINDEKDRTAEAYGRLEREQQQTAAALAAEARRRKQAREALDLLLFQVLEDWLARQEKILPAHKKIVGQVLASYEELAWDNGQDEATRAARARAQGGVGYIREKLGQNDEAEAAYVRARDLYQQLATDFPGEPQYRQYLALSHNNLGNLLNAAGRQRGAEQALRDAIKVRQRLAADFPAEPRYRYDLARSYNNLGNVLKDSNRAAAAEQNYRDALKLCQQLTAERPAVRPYQQELARSRDNLGNLLSAAGKKRAAEQLFRDAIEVRQRLAADPSAMPEYRQALAIGHLNLGVLLGDTERPREAEQAYRDALKVSQRLAADYPAVPEYRKILASIHNNLGVVLRKTERWPEAEQAYRDALKLLQQLVDYFPDVADYHYKVASTMVNLADLLRLGKQPQLARQQLEQAVGHHQAALKANPRHRAYRQSFCNNRRTLGDTLIDLGEHAAAADTAVQVVKAAVNPAGDIYHAARIFARCVPLAEHDAQLPESQRKELAQTYADRALATLRQAVQKGYKDVANLKKDQDLDPLRSRDEFQKLVAELEEKGKIRP
jgi:serine/threonine-protein kinase